MLSGKVLYAVHEGTYVIKLHGEIRIALCGTLANFLDKMFDDAALNGVLVDLTQARSIDSTALGLLAKIAVRIQAQFQQRPTMISTNADVNRVLNSMGFEEVFKVLAYNPCGICALNEVPEADDYDEQLLCDRVLEAHKILVTLNERNKTTFKQVVAALEREQLSGLGS